VRTHFVHSRPIVDESVAAFLALNATPFGGTHVIAHVV
jgi:hypothetical protein